MHWHKRVHHNAEMTVANRIPSRGHGQGVRAAVSHRAPCNNRTVSFKVSISGLLQIALLRKCQICRQHSVLFTLTGIKSVPGLCLPLPNASNWSAHAIFLWWPSLLQETWLIQMLPCAYSLIYCSDPLYVWVFPCTHGCIIQDRCFQQNQPKKPKC